MITYALIFTISLMISFLITPTIRYVGLKFDVIDKKSKRKIHRKVITKLGGAAIFVAFTFAALSGFLLEYVTMKPFIGKFGVILIGSSIILCLGVYDDVRGANAAVKIITQILASLVLVKYQMVIHSINTPFGVIELGNLAIPFTVFFVVGLTNAINLIDGIDGLAAGTVCIISLGLFLLVISTGSSPLVAYLSIALAGATLGFLRYNTFPAKIFMGDTGSLFLGFLLAAVSIECASKGPHLIPFINLLIFLGFPIFDTAFALVRRLSFGKHPFKADDSHFHYWLLRKGFTQRQAVFVLYLVTASLAFIANWV